MNNSRQQFKDVCAVARGIKTIILSLFALLSDIAHPPRHPPPPRKYPQWFSKNSLFETAIIINRNKPGFQFHFTEIFFTLNNAEVLCTSGTFYLVASCQAPRGGGGGECVHVTNQLRVGAHALTGAHCTLRLWNKQGCRNCGSPVLRRQREVAMTHNYPPRRVRDESLAAACWSVKGGGGRSGRCLSLRGRGGE